MMFALSSLTLLAQERVDIELINTPPDQPCQILLWPQQPDDAVLSNIVFTLKWKTGYRLALGGVLESPIPLSPVGASIDIGRYSYRTYTGIGMDSVRFHHKQPIVILVDKQGVGKVMIATDEFLERPAFNASYYISVGGRDVTGVVIEPTNNPFVEQHTTDNTPIMYYDQERRQMLTEKNGVFRTLLGQPVIVLNKTQLQLVK